MTPEEKINAIFAEFAASLSLDPQGLVLAYDYACLAVDQARVLHFRLLSDSAALDVFMELGPVPPAVRREVCEDLLQGNVLPAAAQAAAVFVADCLKATPDEADERLGVWLESVLPRLMQNPE